MDYKLETKDTPESYLSTLPKGKKLGTKMQVWYVQRTGKPYAGVVTEIIPEEEAYDAEALVLGFAPGKAYDSVGIGRHGNFLQWGYAAAPSEMTPAGRKLFINCICYIHKFDGKPPVVHHVAMDHGHLLSVINYYEKKPPKSTGLFPRELEKKYDSNFKDLARYYRENIQIVFQGEDNLYYIDEELKSLGFQKNRELTNLKALINLLSNDEKKAKAHVLLQRYTNKSFETAEEWQRWLTECRERIVFSQRGGYKFFVLPKSNSTE